MVDDQELRIAERLAKLEIMTEGNTGRIRRLENAILGVLGALSAAWTKIQGLW